MTGRLNGKTAIITGASKGIGAGIARIFAHEGAQLLLHGRDEAKLSALARELSGSRYLVGDVSKAEDMQAMANEAIKHFDKIDILCQNAGIYPQSTLEDMSVEQWDNVINVNLRGTFLAVKACLPAMIKQRYGRVVLTSSISGPKVAWPTGAHYTASKAGMNGFMITAAVELAKYGITINAVEPGNILTEGMGDLSPEWVDNMRKAIPVGRLGTPEEVALTALFLASDDARFITGQGIVVDGGQILPESHFQRY